MSPTLSRKIRALCLGTARLTRQGRPRSFARTLLTIDNGDQPLAGGHGGAFRLEIE